MTFGMGNLEEDCFINKPKIINISYDFKTKILKLCFNCHTNYEIINICVLTKYKIIDFYTA